MAARPAGRDRRRSSASWDLSFADGHEPFHHLPRDFLYRSKLPKTKFLSPYPDAVFNGGIEVGGERIEIEGWRGMIGHNWGAEHAERWVWIQGSGFEGHSPEDYFDMAVGRIKVAGRTTPWVGNAMLMLDGRSHRLGGFGHVPEHRGEERPTGATSSSRARASKVTGNVSAAAKDFVAWIYADPVGPEHNTLNCSISDLRAATSSSTAGRPSASPSRAPPPTSSGPGTTTTASRSSPTRTAETEDRLLLLEERPGVGQAEGGRELRTVDRRRAAAADQVGLHDPRRGAALGDDDVRQLAAQPQSRGSPSSSGRARTSASSARRGIPRPPRRDRRRRAGTGSAAARSRARRTRCSRCDRRRSRRRRSGRPCPGRGRPADGSRRPPGRSSRSRRRNAAVGLAAGVVEDVEGAVGGGRERVGAGGHGLRLERLDRP